MSSPPRQPSTDALITELSNRPRALVSSGRYALRVVSGPDAGAEVTVESAARVLIGQSAACHLKLTDRTVSRRHVAAEATHDGVRFTDLQSTNGTWIGAMRLLDGVVAAEQSVRVGDTVIQCLRIDDMGDANGGSGRAPVHRFGRVVGASPQMQHVYALCDRIAQTDLPVVIEGETGTGKELLAEALHEKSGRKDGPFIVLDCTTVPATLLESTLFGHERGAFTGADEKQIGVFEAANGGTLFIDEIGDLALPLQSRLLRAIQSGEVQRVGATKWTKVDVRVISATRRDLDREVQEGRFRDDLFYRLAVARVELPPLRRREGDVRLLTSHLWRELEGEGDAPEELLARFERYEWPGNVRELRNAVAKNVALGDPSAEEMHDESPIDSAITDSVDRILSRDLPFTTARDEMIADFERRYVARVLAKYGGSVQRAAVAAGIKRRYFQLLKARHKS